MTKITTEDCKLFLLDLYKDKNGAKWKRIRKFKDQNGDVCREFSHSDGTLVTLVEKKCQLSVLLSQYYTESLENKVNQKNKEKQSGQAFFTLFDDASKKSAKRLVSQKKIRLIRILVLRVLMRFPTLFTFHSLKIPIQMNPNIWKKLLQI